MILELKIKNFKGVFMRDELTSQKATSNECMIMNIDSSANEGTHWTCLFIKNGVSYYFDSYGFEPPLEVLSYCKCRRTVRVRRPLRIRRAGVG